MYALVKLLAGFRKPLLYKIPDDWKASVHVGSIIHVPLKNKRLPALVIKIMATLPPHTTFEVKQADTQEEIPHDPFYQTFIKKVADFYALEPWYFYQRIKSFLASKPSAPEEDDIPSSAQEHDNPYTSLHAITLTDEQRTVTQFLTPFIDTPEFKPTLLHGITGSGKTEVYKQLISHCIAQGKSALLMLPEVSLSVQFERLLIKAFGDSYPLYSFHSATKPKDKKELWQKLLSGQPCLIIGVHLPIFLPIPHLGSIIIDEEHDASFQEKKHPRINSKHAALMRAHVNNIPILLGSATPCLTSLHQVEKKKWHFFKLTKRFSGSLPTFIEVNLTSQQAKKRKNFWISSQLEDAIKQRLLRKEQTIIYINRRGFSFFVQCKSCGFTFVCTNCSVSLTVHKEHDGSTNLLCHYCNYHQPLPSRCTSCHAAEKELLKKGVGTQHITSALQELFPSAVIARADLDTTKQKKEWHKTVEAFTTGEIDILVGTQLITKGYHFPNVTLVGIIWADLNLHFPVFDAGLTTLQKLIQVAGRAGRGTKKSEVVVQAFAHHEIFDYLDEEKYVIFCEKEKELRKQAGYPPFMRLAYIELKSEDARQLDQDAATLAQLLTEQIEKKHLAVTLLGPSLPLVHRIQKMEMRQILLKAHAFNDLQKLARAIPHEEIESSVYYVPLL